MVQKALMKAMRVAERDGDALKGVRERQRWLAAVARNMARDTIRRQQRRNRIQRDNVEEIRETVGDVMDSGWAVDRLSEQVLDAARNTLPPRQVTIVRSILRGMTDKQIAEEFSVSMSTVRWHRHRAIRSLRRTLLASARNPSE